MLQQLLHRAGRCTRRSTWTGALFAVFTVPLSASHVIAQDTVIVVPYNKSTIDEAYNTDSIRRKRSVETLQPQINHIGSLYFSIPEYHDQQQFQIGPNAYGPMAYIYASPYIAAYTNMSDIQEQGPYGTFAALVEVDALAGVVLPPPYAALSLQPGVNCLWLANPTGNIPAGWRAYVTPQAGGMGCIRPTPGPGAPTPLRVYYTPAAPYKHADIPPVARFGEAQAPPTAAFGQPLLGVPCLDGWCEVGPAIGFVPRAGGSGIGKKGNIKGWYDEQMLAYQDATGVLRPAVRAVLEPVDTLEKMSMAKLSTTVDATNPNVGWVQMATIILGESDPPTSTKYWKWGLRRGENILYLRNTTTGWQMSIKHRGGHTRWIWQDVKLEQHFDVPVPGTARWRFASYDPFGVWFRCGDYCCSGSGGS